MGSPSGVRRKGRLMADESGQIAGWLVKLFISILIGGYIILEAGSLVIAKMTVLESTDLAASAAVTALESNDNPEDAARAVAVEKGAEFQSITVDQSARTVTVTLSRNAKTLLLHNIDQLERYRVQRATKTKMFDT